MSVAARNCERAVRACSSEKVSSISLSTARCIECGTCFIFFVGCWPNREAIRSRLCFTGCHHRPVERRGLSQRDLRLREEELAHAVAEEEAGRVDGAAEE